MFVCCHKRSTITAFGECKGPYCAQCMDAHTCGDKIVFQAHEK